MASASYFRKKTEQNQLGLLTVKRERIISAPSGAFLYSLKCKYSRVERNRITETVSADKTEIIVVKTKHKHVKPFKTKAHWAEKNLQLWLFLDLYSKDRKGGISKIVKETLDVTCTSTITVTLRKWRQLSEPAPRWRLGLAKETTGFVWALLRQWEM